MTNQIPKDQLTFDAMMTVHMAFTEGNYSHAIFWKDADSMASKLGVDIEEYDIWINTVADMESYTHVTSVNLETVEGGVDTNIHQSSVSQLIEDFWFRNVNWNQVG